MQCLKKLRCLANTVLCFIYYFDIQDVMCFQYLFPRDIHFRKTWCKRVSGSLLTHATSVAYVRARQTKGRLTIKTKFRQY